MPVGRTDMQLVEKITARFRGRHVYHYDDDEVLSDGMLALHHAVEAWDARPRRGEARSTFLSIRIKSRVIDGIRSRNGDSRTMYGKQVFEKRMLRLDWEAAGATAGTTGEETFGERYVGYVDPGFSDVEWSDFFDALSPREKLVVLRVAWAGWTMEELGRELGISASRVGIIWRMALAKLRYPDVQPRKERMRMPSNGSYPFDLTSREVEVLQAIADGLRNEEVGERLFISLETVKGHVKHALAKMNANSRTHAVAIGFREGFIM